MSSSSRAPTAAGGPSSCTAACGLSALDEALDRDSAQIEAAAEALAMSVELERIDRFAEALHAGYILPEDF